MTGGLLRKRAEQCFLEGSEAACHPKEAGPTSSSEEAGEGTALAGYLPSAGELTAQNLDLQ